MKKIIAILLAVCMLFASSSVYAVSEEPTTETNEEQGQPDASVTDGCHTLDAQKGILGERQLIRNSTAAFLYEYTSDTLMYSWNGDMQISPASLVKIMTALIAVQKGNLSDTVTVNAESFSSLPHDAALTSPALADGEVLTLEDLLNCMMIGSANDAAIAIAEHISGTQAAFVDEMNRYAQELGCTNTNFTNVHGIHDSAQYSTARDIARILDEAVNYDEFMKVFGAIYYTVPETNIEDEIRLLTTGNFLLTQDEMETYYDGRVTGGRTGADINDDRCIATTATKDGLNMICIIIGAKMVYEEDGYTVTSFGGFPETSDLLDYGFDGYKSVQILHEGQILKQLDVENGDCDLTIGSRTAVSTVIPSNVYLEDLNFAYSDTSNLHTAPIEKGQYVSTVRITYGNLCLAEADLYAMNSVRSLNDSFTIEVSDNSSRIVWTIILVIVSVAAVVVLLIFGLPRIRRMRYRIRKRKAQQGRRY